MVILSYGKLVQSVLHAFYTKGVVELAKLNAAFDSVYKSTITRNIALRTYAIVDVLQLGSSIETSK